VPTVRKHYNLPEEVIDILSETQREYGCTETEALMKMLKAYQRNEILFRGVSHIKLCRPDGSEEEISIQSLL
jgi:hypothetical protein